MEEFEKKCSRKLLALASSNKEAFHSKDRKKILENLEQRKKP